MHYAFVFIVLCMRCLNECLAGNEKICELGDDLGLLGAELPVGSDGDTQPTQSLENGYDPLKVGETEGAPKVDDDETEEAASSTPLGKRLSKKTPSESSATKTKAPTKAASKKGTSTKAAATTKATTKASPKAAVKPKSKAKAKKDSDDESLATMKNNTGASSVMKRPARQETREDCHWDV